MLGDALGHADVSNRISEQNKNRNIPAADFVECVLSGQTDVYIFLVMQQTSCHFK
jgi:hypothetical protein